MRKPITWITLLALVMIALLWRGFHPSGEIATDLLFGWIGFLRRTTSRITLRWDGISVFVIALAAATVIAHFVLRSFRRQCSANDESPQRSWRLRWTVSLMAFVVLAFVAGISFVGVTHQTSWLLTSPTPLYGRNIADGRSTSRWNLKNLGLGVINCASGSDFPPRMPGTDEGPDQSWVIPILPYLGGGYIMPDIDFTRAWDDPVNQPHFKAMVPELINPSFRNPPLRDVNGFGLSHYAGNAELFDPEQPLSANEQLFDQSNLLLIGEANAEFVPWGQPGNSRDAAEGLQSPHGFGGVPGESGTLFVMADGSVRLIDNDIDPAVLEALAHPVNVPAESLQSDALFP